MEKVMTKRTVLSVAMLLAPFVICLTVFADLMNNIDHYNLMADLGKNVWAYFSITLITAIVGLVSAAYILVLVFVLKKDIKHIRTVIAISHLGFLLEVYYIIQYVTMPGGTDNPIAVTALIFGVASIIGFFIALALKKGPNFVMYFISALLYFIFMVLMTSLLGTRNNGMHIILLVFYSVAIGLASYGIYYFYLRKHTCE